MKATIDALKNAGFDVKLGNHSIIVSLSRDVTTQEVWVASKFGFNRNRASKVGKTVVIDCE